jgi:hypothetical protein
MIRHLLNVSAVLVFVLLLGSNALRPQVMFAQTGTTSKEQSGTPRSQGLEIQENLQQRQEEYLRQHSDSFRRVRPDLWLKGVSSVLDRKALGPISGVQWAQIGPSPLRIDMEQIFQGAGPDSGEVVDIAIDPSGIADQTVFIATNDGGIWKSIDAGVTWTPKTDFMPSLSMGAVALDPGNASIVYAGTGNKFDGGGVFFKGVGLYKSTNGGDTWVVLNPGSIFTPNVGINRIVFPASNTLLVATSNGLFKSVDGGSSFGANAPTFNNGLPVLAGFISDLDLDTGTSTTAYASVSGSGIFQSTDSGSTFPTNLFNNAGAPATPYGFIALSQSTQPNNQTMYASVQGAPFKGLFKSTDAGGSWAVQAGAAFTGTANGGCQCGYDQTVGVDPQNASRVYIGFQELYLSTDGAGSFGATAVSRNKVHWDHHALIFSPQSHWGAAPTPIYVGTDGGIATSSNGGTTWSNINEGIATNLYTSIDIGRGSVANNAFTYGGAQDTGTTERRPGFAGNDWHLGVDGDGGSTVVDSLNSMHAYGLDDANFMFTVNGGTNWVFPCGTGLPPTSFVPACGSPAGLAFRLAVDPNNGATLYAASSGNRLFQSTNSGTTFTSIRSFPASIDSLATVNTDSNTLWVGLDNGTVQRTSNALAGAGSVWTPLTVTGAPPGQFVSGIAIDPTSTAQVVVVYPGFTGINSVNRTKHVFRTTDNGLTWNDVSGTDGGFVFNNLPDLPLHAAVIDPNTTPHSIIVAGDTGVMRSIDNGAAWHVLGVDLPTVDCTSLAIDPGPTPGLLRVGSYGRSVFELMLGSCTLTCANITQSTDLDQCGAVVTFTPATTGTCGTVTCTPPSGSFFPKGTTSVTCLSAGPSCSFTVTVNDTQAPTITCPGDINVAAAVSCPIATSAPVSFTVTASDNCPGVTIVCKDQNGAVVTTGVPFPVGTATVTCTATDTSGNMTSCSFNVNVFSFCLQDETNAGNVVLVNARTGDFFFCCGGVPIASGRGILHTNGCIGTIDHQKGNRKTHIEWDTAANNSAGAGIAFVQKLSDKIVCQITDKNMSNNACQCSGPPPPVAPKKPPTERTF